MTWQEPSQAALQILEVLHWSGIGPARVRDVIKTHGGGDFRERAAQLFPKNVPSERAAVAIRDDVARIVNDCRERDIFILAMPDASYPARLSQIADAPPIIYYRGSSAGFSMPCVAVVGTRQASDAGARAASLIASKLVSWNYCVVSGLALGIDAAAHAGAVDANGVTIAILAHGLDTVQPASNRTLAARILAGSGALVSEHPPGVPPRPAEFVRRNRLQSGMSICSIIVESKAEGGAIHQANFTHKQKRGLFVVLSNSQPKKLEEGGARRLMRELGAVPITGTAELAVKLRELGQNGRGIDEQPHAGGFTW